MYTNAWWREKNLASKENSKLETNKRTNNKMKGSGCGSVGRVVDSESRGPQFESSHRQKIMLNIPCQL